MLPDNDLKAEAYKLVILSDLTDTKMESDNPYVNMLLTLVRPAQIGMKQRYDKAQKDGLNGGRPPLVDHDKVLELRNNGYTQCQIANTLGCHVNTIKRILKENSEDPESGGKVQKGTIRYNNSESEEKYEKSEDDTFDENSYEDNFMPF